MLCACSFIVLDTVLITCFSGGILGLCAGAGGLAAGVLAALLGAACIMGHAALPRLPNMGMPRFSKWVWGGGSLRWPP